LDDKKPMTDEDTLVIITCPDPPSLKAVQRLAETALEKGCPLVMFNPRLASGDVGIGVAARDMRLNFLSTFNYVYSLAPIPYANGAHPPFSSRGVVRHRTTANATAQPTPTASTLAPAHPHMLCAQSTEAGVLLGGSERVPQVPGELAGVHGG
jgi:hypothetical protein